MGEKQTLQINSFNKIKKYTKNIDSFSNSKNKGYEICQRYLAMKNNLKNYEQYKQSNEVFWWN